MRIVLLGFLLLSLAGCGGGGGGGGTPPSTNNSPVADAGADQGVDEQTLVTLDGSASSDPDGDTLSYAWSQTAGTGVTLSSASSAQPSFTAPDVGLGNTETLTFQLQVGDARATSTDSVTITVDGVTNSDPVVDAGNASTAAETMTVSLSGSATDSDIGDTLSYSWTQIGGTSVSISNADQAAASFLAPAVGPGGDVLTFQLAVNDGTTTVFDSVNVDIVELPSSVTVSGNVQYEFPPPRVNCNGLNFNAIEIRPIRAATVQLIAQGSGAVLGTTVASDQGDYSFAGVPPLTQVRVRVRAELKNSGLPPNWDVEIRDNYDPGGSLPLASRALYVLDSSFFDSGFEDQDRDFTATTGWGGSSYTGARAAAPFAILDTIYSMMEFVQTADPNIEFQPLDVFWSVNNVAGSPINLDTGEVGTFYQRDIDSLVLLGDANNDTDEFDDHVVSHEWSHFFDDTISRSDSVGGRHFVGDSLDARLAWGEGAAYALGSMGLNDPLTCDTGAPGTNAGFGIDAESDGFGTQGWFNEISVTTLIWDLWDTEVDGADTGSIEWSTLYAAMTGPLVSTPAYVTAFSYAAELRPSLNPTEAALLDDVLGMENISTVNLDVWGTGATNDSGGGRDVLPLYTDITAGGPTLNICTNSDFDDARDGNKLAEYRYLRVNVPVTDTYTVTMTTTTATPVTPDPDDRDQSDPDFYIYGDGQFIAQGVSSNANLETLQVAMTGPDIYVMDVQDWRHADEDGAPDSYPERICFDISITP